MHSYSKFEMILLSNSCSLSHLHH